MSEPIINEIVKAINEVDKQITLINDKIRRRTGEVIDAQVAVFKDRIYGEQLDPYPLSTDAVIELQLYQFAARRFASAMSAMHEIGHELKPNGVTAQPVAHDEFIQSLREALTPGNRRRVNGSVNGEDEVIVTPEERPDVILRGRRRVKVVAVDPVRIKKLVRAKKKEKEVQALSKSAMTGFQRMLDWSLGYFNTRKFNRYRRNKVAKVLGMSNTAATHQLNAMVEQGILLTDGVHAQRAYKLNARKLDHAKSLLLPAR